MSLTEEEKANLREFIASGEYQLDRQSMTHSPQQNIAEAMTRVGALSPEDARKLLATWAQNKALMVQIHELARQRQAIVIL